MRLAVAALAALVVLAVPSSAAAIDMGNEVPSVEYEGIQKLSYRYGPVEVKPGANSIKFEPNNLKPQVPGYITRFEPNLIYADGKRGVPPVDVIHLHHGVWVINLQPVFAAGEEKTIVQMPRGFGWKHDPSDQWIMNHMIHNLLPDKDKVWITYDVDFVPMSSPAAKDIRPVKVQWMDVAGVRGYPVFDVKRRWGGRDGRYTFPDDARGAERRKIGPAYKWVPDRDITLVGTAGHLHPGGLYTDLFAHRGAAKKHLFRSEAKYWEPAGAVSWDVAMTATRPDWRVKVKRNDILKVSATYDTRRGSWYESMGIMPLLYYEGHDAGGTDAFEGAAAPATGSITHGRLPENSNHGGTDVVLPDARRLLGARGARSAGSLVEIRDFLYARGDLSLEGDSQRPPVIRPGQSLRFKNADAADDIYHTITACRAPCNRNTGIAYPLANGPVDFDSGELGFGPRFATPTENRDTWQTPRNLSAGTYTYFCRVHPFMRGSFRVKKSRG